MLARPHSPVPISERRGWSSRGGKCQGKSRVARRLEGKDGSHDGRAHMKAKGFIVEDDGHNEMRQRGKRQRLVWSRDSRRLWFCCQWKLTLLLLRPMVTRRRLDLQKPEPAPAPEPATASPKDQMPRLGSAGGDRGQTWTDQPQAAVRVATATGRSLAHAVGDSLEVTCRPNRAWLL